MREIYSVAFLILILALISGVIFAFRSRRPIGKSVALLLGALVPPMAGNLLIIQSQTPSLSYVGCYLYFIGMNIVMFALLRYTLEYCEISSKGRKLRWIAYILLIADTISLLCNIFAGHAFSLERIIVSEQVYYRFVPLLGQTFHRVIDYGIFLVILIIFLVKMIRSSKVYLEKYAVIFGAMIVFGIWQSYYIFSRTPVDRSMIGFGVFGLLVFYFSIVYRPMRLLDRMLVSMASELSEALLFFDLNAECIWANEKAQKLLNIKPKEVEKANLVMNRVFGEPPVRNENWSEQKKVKIDGETKEFFMQKKTVFDTKGRVAGSFLSIRDNTAEKEELQIERFHATHDSSTGLYNKNRLYEKVRETLDANPKTEYCIAVASIDDFEVLNDVYGTAFGEEAVRQVSEWIGVELPEDSICGRIGEFEFGALVLTGRVDLNHLEHDLSHATVRSGSIIQQVFIHFGVYYITEPELDISIMFDRARLAFSKVKDDLTEYVGFYEDALRDNILWNQQISAELKTALEEEQIVPYLQPIMDASGQLVGAEVLARWIHPTAGFLNPSRFIPVFEKNGLIAEIDRHMWRRACEILKMFQQKQIDLFLSVNISPKDFDVMDVASEIKALVKEYKISPKQLRLEITESALGVQQIARIELLRKLREEGFFIEMDDFGSGYSSMNLLKDMPLDLLKLDMVFLEKSVDVERAKTIVKIIITMAHQLGIISLMEGVETDRQYQILAEMGCEYFQGFYFSKPVPLPKFLETVNSQTSLS